jgi:hypothetical protein
MIEWFSSLQCWANSTHASNIPRPPIALIDSPTIALINFLKIALTDSPIIALSFYELCQSVVPCRPPLHYAVHLIPNNPRLTSSKPSTPRGAASRHQHLPSPSRRLDNKRCLCRFSTRSTLSRYSARQPSPRPSPLRRLTSCTGRSRMQRS